MKFSSTSYLSITLSKLLSVFVPRFPHWSKEILTLKDICMDAIKYAKYIVKWFEFLTEKQNDDGRENNIVRVQINKIKGGLFVCPAIQFTGTKMFCNSHPRHCTSCQHTAEWFWSTPGLYNTGWQPGLLDLLLLLLIILISSFNHTKLEKHSFFVKDWENIIKQKRKNKITCDSTTQTKPSLIFVLSDFSMQIIGL